MSRMTGKFRFVLLALSILTLDQWTKWWIEISLEMHEVVSIVPGLNLTRVVNTGVAFGLLPARGNLVGTALLTILGLVALIVIATFFLRAASRERWLLAGLGLILGGAVGNLVDRVMNGAVTDFIDVYVGTYHWHTFNVADSAITAGIACMILDSLFHSRISENPDGVEDHSPSEQR
jgi:signal peptidase II